MAMTTMTQRLSRTQKSSILTTAVLISALGYFVDIYDLLLFGIVRVASLQGIGVPEDQLLTVGISLINKQMAGMLIGGVLWGILGDKKGRVSVLFGSILIYSLANIANGFIQSEEWYGVCRFLAGVGLAGELGAAITLVSESLSKEHRGYGTTIVASIGILGAVFAGIIGDIFPWRTAYIIGGVMGLLLLVMRVSVYESSLFQTVKEKTHRESGKKVRMGDIRMLFYPWPRFTRYLSCILIGVPIWFVVGILVTFSPELSKALGMEEAISAGKAILFCYLGMSMGDVASGLLSQYLRSRRTVVFLFLGMTLFFVGTYLLSSGISSSAFYFICFALGFSSGYWAIFISLTAEQFGTNLRATATTTVPNFVRGSVVLLTSAFQALQPGLGLVNSAWVVGLTTLVLAGFAANRLEETFARDLEYVEAH